MLKLYVDALGSTIPLDAYLQISQFTLASDLKRVAVRMVSPSVL